jgi:hypothetical protein
MLKRLVASVVAGVLTVGLLASPANAHNIASSLNVQFPTFFFGDWTFPSTHNIIGCVEGGDPTPCSQGFSFNVWSGAQIKLVGTWTALGSVVKSPALHWPTNNAVTATFFFNCASGDQGKQFTLRTRGKAGVKHNGLWTFTSFSFSAPRTETCP